MKKWVFSPKEVLGFVFLLFFGFLSISSFSPSSHAVETELVIVNQDAIVSFPIGEEGRPLLAAKSAEIVRANHMSQIGGKQYTYQEARELSLDILIGKRASSYCTQLNPEFPTFLDCQMKSEPHQTIEFRESLEDQREFFPQKEHVTDVEGVRESGRVLTSKESNRLPVECLNPVDTEEVPHYKITELRCTSAVDVLQNDPLPYFVWTSKRKVNQALARLSPDHQRISQEMANRVCKAKGYGQLVAYGVGNFNGSIDDQDYYVNGNELIVGPFARHRPYDRLSEVVGNPTSIDPEFHPTCCGSTPGCRFSKCQFLSGCAGCAAGAAIGGSVGFWPPFCGAPVGACIGGATAWMVPVLTPGLREKTDACYVCMCKACCSCCTRKPSPLTMEEECDQQIEEGEAGTGTPVRMVSHEQDAPVPLPSKIFTRIFCR